ncbi:hypothetical protein AV944_07820 [Sphingomonas sp. LK11]|jgi:hypothetical protein|nr:hypothetical protein AV944_07820 [Sphingomonas sp. LK11]
MRFSKFRLAVLFAATAMTSAAMAATNYSPAKVIQAMKKDNTRLRIIAEHRGYFHQDCPENSICSIEETTRENVEAVEIDVRESGDGTLWPIHDTTLGRMTNYSLNGRLFDPYSTSQENEHNNPQISRVRDALLEKLKLRDPLGAVTDYAFLPLETMMHKVDQLNRNLVYIFDIKTASGISKTADMIWRLGIQDRSILKFNSTLTSPSYVHSLTGGLYFVPVIGTGSLDTIADHYHQEKSTPAERVGAYAMDYAHTAGFVYFELRNKMFGGRTSGSELSGVYFEGPMLKLDTQLAFAGVPIGGFSPQVEHYARNGQPGTGYYSVDGHCCTPLEARLDSSRDFGNDTRDDRSNTHQMVAVNQVIIAERAGDALAEARRTGARADQNSILY